MADVADTFPRVCCCCCAAAVEEVTVAGFGNSCGCFCTAVTVAWAMVLMVPPGCRVSPPPPGEEPRTAVAVAPAARRAPPVDTGTVPCGCSWIWTICGCPGVDSGCPEITVG